MNLRSSTWGASSENFLQSHRVFWRLLTASRQVHLWWASSRAWFEPIGTMKGRQTGVHRVPRAGACDHLRVLIPMGPFTVDTSSLSAYDSVAWHGFFSVGDAGQESWVH